MTVTVTEKRLKASTLAKAKKTVKLFNVKKPQGSVTYKKRGGSKYLAVNRKSGKVTVRKGTPSGSYRIKVAVTASGDASHRAKTAILVAKVSVLAFRRT